MSLQAERRHPDGLYDTPAERCPARRQGMAGGGARRGVLAGRVAVTWSPGLAPPLAPPRVAAPPADQDELIGGRSGPARHWPARRNPRVMPTAADGHLADRIVASVTRARLRGLDEKKKKKKERMHRNVQAAQS